MPRHRANFFDYGIFLDTSLLELSLDFYPKQVRVAGYMTIRGGYQVVAQCRLRLASARHATSHEAGSYLPFDRTQPVQKLTDLLKELGSDDRT